MSAASAQQYLAQSSTTHLQAAVSNTQIAKAQLAGAGQKKVSGILQAVSVGALSTKGAIKTGRKLAPQVARIRKASGVRRAASDALRQASSGNPVSSHSEEFSRNIDRDEPSSILSTMPSEEQEVHRYTGATGGTRYDFDEAGHLQPRAAGFVEGTTGNAESLVSSREASSLASTADEAVGGAVGGALDTAAATTTTAAAAEGGLNPVADAAAFVSDIGALGAGIASAVEGISGEQKSETAVSELKPASVSGFQKSSGAY